MIGHRSPDGEGRRPRPLPDHLKALFRESFPEVDLDRVRVHDRLPWIARFAPIDVRAMALGRHIYLVDRDAHSLDGIATIGHELAHVAQWQRAGGVLPGVLAPVRFAVRYVGEYLLNRLRGMGKVDAYRNISFEREAARFERSIRTPDRCGDALVHPN